MATNRRTPGLLTEAVAAEIRALMARRKWKQVDLSASTGIHKATLSALLNAQTAMDVEQLGRMAVALEVNPGEVLYIAFDNTQTGESEEVYLPDGSLNPENTKMSPPTVERLKRLAARKKPDSPD